MSKEEIESFISDTEAFVKATGDYVHKWNDRAEGIMEAADRDQKIRIARVQGELEFIGKS